MKIDFKEYEKQRRAEIKKSDQYLELNILISADEHDLDKDAPIVTMEQHHCGPIEIAKLYAILTALQKELETSHPMECSYAKTHMKTSTVEASLEPLDEQNKEQEDVK